MPASGSASAKAPATPVYNASTAPKAAPLDTPSKPGSARGLRSSPCSAAPDTPKAAPTAMHNRVRGMRKSSKMRVAITSPDQVPRKSRASGIST